MRKFEAYVNAAMWEYVCFETGLNFTLICWYDPANHIDFSVSLIADDYGCPANWFWA